MANVKSVARFGGRETAPARVGREDELENNDIEHYEPPKGKQKKPPPKTSPGHGAPLKKYKPPPTQLEIDKAKLRSRRTNDPTFPLLLHSYNMHRNRVETAKPVVDTSCPIVAKNTYSNPTSFNRRIANFTRIERDNAIMTQRISRILQGESYIDNKLKTVTKNINNRGRARQMKLLRITFDNLALLKRIQDQKPTYCRKKQIEEYDKREKIMERLSYYPLFWKQMKLKGWEAYERCAMQNANNDPRPRVFLDLATDNSPLGRVIIELRADVVPMTAENFRALCTGEYGLSYKCSKIHRIIPDILWQGGDVSGMDGYGNKSIYGDKFPNENFRLRHDKAGVVSMANIGEDTNGSQFIIDARPMPALDKKNVVVGKVIAGMKVMLKCSKLVTSTGRLRRKIFIIGCGQLSPDADISPWMDSDEEEEGDEGEGEEGGEYEGGGRGDGGDGLGMQAQVQNPQSEQEATDYNNATETSSRSGNDPDPIASDWDAHEDEIDTVWHQPEAEANDE